MCKYMEQKLNDRVFRFTWRSGINKLAIFILLSGAIVMTAMIIIFATDLQDHFLFYCLIISLCFMVPVYQVLCYINRILIVTGRDIQHTNAFRQTKSWTWDQVTRCKVSEGKVNYVKFRFTDGKKFSVSSDMKDFYVLCYIGNYYNLQSEEDNVRRTAIELGVDRMLREKNR